MSENLLTVDLIVKKMMSDSDHFLRTSRAFSRGLDARSIYEQPYPDDTDEATHWVDGYCAGLKERGYK